MFKFLDGAYHDMPHVVAASFLYLPTSISCLPPSPVYLHANLGVVGGLGQGFGAIGL